mmetsp:Transcript_16706/g.37565  ORF Transcript_16706/g.37565 Transcript_16706/m.37565 type:complete len:217 (+) Transcript_16706:738-1388(+)
MPPRRPQQGQRRHRPETRGVEPRSVLHLPRRRLHLQNEPRAEGRRRDAPGVPRVGRRAPVVTQKKRSRQGRQGREPGGRGDPSAQREEGEDRDQFDVEIQKEAGALGGGRGQSHRLGGVAGEHEGAELEAPAPGAGGGGGGSGEEAAEGGGVGEDAEGGDEEAGQAEVGGGGADRVVHDHFDHGVLGAPDQRHEVQQQEGAGFGELRVLLLLLRWR